MPLTTPLDVNPSPVPLLPRDGNPHLDRAARAGELIRVARGIYAPAAAWAGLAPWQRYLARVHAAALDYPDAIFVRESAAALRGLPVFGEPAYVHLVAAGGTTTRSIGHVRIHGAERIPQYERIGAMLVASLAEIAADAARLQHPAVALSVAGAALRMNPSLTRGEMQALSETHPSSRGRRRARWVFGRASGVPESPLENVSIAAIEWLGFPAPDLQVWVRGSQPGEDDRLDFCWPAWGIGGEADGNIKYSGEMGDARLALRNRGARDARLMRRGIPIVRHWSWDDVADPELLRTILLSAGLPIVRPREGAPLRSLPHALRGRA